MFFRLTRKMNKKSLVSGFSILEYTHTHTGQHTKNSKIKKINKRRSFFF